MASRNDRADSDAAQSVDGSPAAPYIRRAHGGSSPNAVAASARPASRNGGRARAPRTVPGRPDARHGGGGADMNMSASTARLVTRSHGRMRRRYAAASAVVPGAVAGSSP